MCALTKIHFKRCGHTHSVWDYCSYIYDNAVAPRVKVHETTREIVSNCKYHWEQPDKIRNNCCSFECCVHDVETNQDCVRKYEALLGAAPGSRYGVDFEPSWDPEKASKLSERQAAAMPNWRLAHNYSMQQTWRHLDSCSDAIKPRAKETQGFLTHAHFEILQLSIDEVMSLETQRSRIWDAFSVDIARGISRYKKEKHSDPEELKEFLQKIRSEPGYSTKATQKAYDSILEARDKGRMLRSMIPLRLIYLENPWARHDIEAPVEHPPPAPNFEGDDEDNKKFKEQLEHNKTVVGNPDGEYQKIINSPVVGKFRALFLDANAGVMPTQSQPKEMIHTNTAPKVFMKSS